MADLWEKAAKLASEKRLGETQARKVIAELYQAVNTDALPSATVRDYLTSWANRRKPDIAPRTYAAYWQICREFLEALGERADRDISQLCKADVAKYRDGVVTRTSVSNANKALKYLRVALGAAYKDGLAQENPAAKLDTIRRRHTDIPAMFLLNKRGRIVSTNARGPKLAQEIQRLLKE